MVGKSKQRGPIHSWLFTLSLAQSQFYWQLLPTLGSPVSPQRFKVLDTGVCLQNSQTLHCPNFTFPPRLLGCGPGHQKAMTLFLFSCPSTVLWRLLCMYDMLPIITGKQMFSYLITSASLKPQLFRIISWLGWEPDTSRLQQNPQAFVSSSLMNNHRKNMGQHLPWGRAGLALGKSGLCVHPTFLQSSLLLGSSYIEH